MEKSVETRHADQIKKLNTFQDILKACNSSIRSVENDLTVMKAETKNVQTLVSQSRETSNEIFKTAIDGFESKQSQLLGQLVGFNERVQVALSRIDNTKSMVNAFEK